LGLRGRDVEEGEAAAPGAQELPAGRAGPDRLVVAQVDRRVRDPAREGLLDRPAVGQDPAQGVDVVGLELVLEGPRHRAELPRALDLRLVAGEVPGLLGQNPVRVADVAGVEHQEVVLEFLVGLVPHDHRLHFHEAVRAELVVLEAPEGGGELVLLADRVPQLVDLDVARFLGDLVGRDGALRPGVKEFKQRHRKRGRRAEPGPRGDVGHRGDFDALDAEVLEDLAEDAVLDLVGVGHDLGLRVLERYRFLVEGFVDRQIDVLPDAGREDAAAVFLVERRNVAAAPAEAHAEWRSGDNHCFFFFLSCLF